MSETWLAVVGYEGIYEISDHGKVRSLDRLDSAGKRRRGRYLKTTVSSEGYPRVGLNKNGKKTTWKIATLVALAFIGPRPTGADVCHNDGNPGNSEVSNLRYDTHLGNMQDAIKHGTKTKKEKCPHGHSYSKINTYIDSRGKKHCIECRRKRTREWMKEWRERKRNREAPARMVREAGGEAGAPRVRHADRDQQGGKARS